MNALCLTQLSDEYPTNEYPVGPDPNFHLNFPFFIDDFHTNPCPPPAKQPLGVEQTDRAATEGRQAHVA